LRSFFFYFLLSHRANKYAFLRCNSFSANSKSSKTPEITEYRYSQPFSFKISESGPKTFVAIADKNSNIIKHVTPKTYSVSTDVNKIQKHSRDLHMKKLVENRHKKKLVESPHKLSETSPVIRPIGGGPRGPLAIKEQLEQQFGKLFTHKPIGVHCF
jgi:hypothetical protein